MKNYEESNGGKDDKWLTKPLPLREKQRYSIFDSETSSDDQDNVKLSIKNKRILNVKKSQNNLFGESSDTSM